MSEERAPYGNDRAAKAMSREEFLEKWRGVLCDGWDGPAGIFSDDLNTLLAAENAELLAALKALLPSAAIIITPSHPAMRLALEVIAKEEAKP